MAYLYKMERNTNHIIYPKKAPQGLKAYRNVNAGVKE